MASVLPFQKEPPFSHGQAPVTGILLCNLGTPDAPTTPAVRRYLREFLSDPRVVEIPRAVWLPLLHGIILPLRSSRSAAKYATIWSAEGSPLKVHTERQALGLQARLAARGHRVVVRYAMRYGNPSIASQMDALRAEGAQRVLVLTAYPQYSGTTTASVVDAVNQWVTRARQLPELRFVNRYHDDPAYINALAARISAYWQEHGRPDQLVMSFHGVPERTLKLGDPYHCECHKTGRLLARRLGLSPEQYTVTFQSRFGKAKWLEPYTEPTLQALARTIEAHWATHGRPDHLVMSFHGVPERTLLLGDPYHCECHKTGRLLAERLGLARDRYTVSFQSRFGKAKWLEPYTEPTLHALAKQGVGRVDVACPGFTSDCLETLEEIGMEGKEAFLTSGGKEYHAIPCLNDDPAWIDALADLAERHMGGWPTRAAPDVGALATSRERALAMGAKD